MILQHWGLPTARRGKHRADARLRRFRGLVPSHDGWRQAGARLTSEHERPSGPAAFLPGGAGSSVVLQRWPLLAAALAIGVAVGASIALLHRTPATMVASAALPPAVTWPAGRRPAPGFVLTDQQGRRLRLADFRGRPVILAFIDPLCRNFCPREASILSQAVASVRSTRPAIVAVSVDPWGDTATAFRQDATHWRLSSAWRWGTGDYATLAAVWREYEVGVAVTRRTLAGITVREITHTAAAYVIDGSGDERALLLYPFQPADVVAALKKILSHSD